MANAFALCSSACLSYAWFLALLACGLPLFSAWNVDCNTGSGSPSSMVDQYCLGQRSGAVFVGHGLWGRGEWFYGPPCDARSDAGQSCHSYMRYDNEESYIQGAQAASVLCVLTSTVAIIFGCLTVKNGGGPLGLVTAGLSVVSAVFALAPLGVWEDKMCGGDLNVWSAQSGCGRSWSWGYQLTSLLIFVLCAIAMVFASFENPDE